MQPTQPQTPGEIKHRLAVTHFVRRVLIFFRLWFKDIVEHNCKVEAAALTFFTLLALVPLFLLLAKLVSVVPDQAAYVRQVQQFLLDLLVPESAGIVKEYLNRFASRVNAITIASLPMLLISILVLMLQLEKVLTGIFAMKRRKFLLQLTFCLISIVFGPIVLMLLFSIAAWVKQLFFIGWISWELGTDIISLALQWLLSSMFFILVPARRLPFDLVFLGGLLLVTTQNGLRIGFTRVLGSITNYEMVYGIFAAIPLFLLWIYLCWLLLLIIAVLLQTLRIFQDKKNLPSFDLTP